MSTIDRRYGEIEGLPGRIAYWHERVCTDKSLPWVGLGLIHDLEAVLRLLSLPEFADWLATHPDDDLQRWAAEVRDAVEARTAHAELVEAVDTQLPAGGMSYVGDVQAAGKEVAELAAVRAFLVGQGVLSEGDTTTPVADVLGLLFA